MKRLITTPRGVFNVRVYGAPQNPPLVLVHGWPQTSYCWHHLVSYLKEFYIIAPDLRGMGDSNRALEIHHYEKDELAKDLFAIVDTLGVLEFYLGGHDWGGAIVQEMAFQQPHRIKKLIIMNIMIINNQTGLLKANEVLRTQLFRSGWYQNFMRLRDLPEALLKDKEEIWVRFFCRGISKPIPEDAIAEYIRCYQIPNTITTTAYLYRTLSKDRARWQQFVGQKIAVPTKIIHGLLDPVIIKEYLVGIEDCFSNVEVSYLEGGHFILDEMPEEVGVEIKKFLQEH